MGTRSWWLKPVEQTTQVDVKQLAVIDTTRMKI